MLGGVPEHAATMLCTALRARTETRSSVVNYEHLPRSGYGLPVQVTISVTRAEEVRANLAKQLLFIGLYAADNRKMENASPIGSVAIAHDHDCSQLLHIPALAARRLGKNFLQLFMTNRAALPFSITAYLELMVKP